MRFDEYYGPFAFQETAVTTLLNGVVPVVDFNPRRVVLQIWTSANNAYQLSTKATVGAGQGINIPAASQVGWQLQWPDHGVMVGQPWFAFATVSFNLAVFEVIAQFDLADWKRWQKGSNGEHATPYGPDDLQRSVRRDSASESEAGWPDLLGARSKRVRDLIRGNGVTWRWDQNSGGYAGTPDDGI